jgi:hypothetical protein
MCLKMPLQLLDHFCKRSSEKDPVKPGKQDLFKILLKYIVALGNLIIDRIEEGVPILRRGDATHVTGDDVMADVTCAPVSEDVSVSATQESQLQPHAQQTPSQLALEDARLAKLAYVKETRNRAGEDAGGGAGGQTDQAGCHCGFEEGQERGALQGHDVEAGEAPPMSQDLQGRGVQRDSLRGGGARLHLRAH